MRSIPITNRFTALAQLIMHPQLRRTKTDPDVQISDYGPYAYILICFPFLAYLGFILESLIGTIYLN